MGHAMVQSELRYSQPVSRSLRGRMPALRDRRATAEQMLAVRLCATPAADVLEIVAALEQVTEPVLFALLERLNLLTLLGVRLRAYGARLSPTFEEEVSIALEHAGAQGRMQELIMLSVTAELARDGIVSVPLKGTALARAIHGDAALRVSGDIDLLVHLAELARAVEIAERMGWRRETPARPGRPPLHVTMVHDEMPPLELHWRVHWYEERFSGDALERADAPAASEARRMRPADELATLVLFYVRDGLSGLRLPADIIGWCETRELTDALRDELVGICRTYPQLAPPLAAGVSHLAALVGLPLASPAPVRERERAARRLANPFLVGERTQIRADASFVDILLAPPGGRWAAARRQLDNVPGSRDGRSAQFQRTQASHAVKTAARWSASAARATVAPRSGGVGVMRGRGV
jgi:hypothetical protein